MLTKMNGHNTAVAPQGVVPAATYNAFVQKVQNDVALLSRAMQQLGGGHAGLDQRIKALEGAVQQLGATLQSMVRSWGTGIQPPAAAQGGPVVDGTAVAVSTGGPAPAVTSANGTPLESFSSPEDAATFLSGGEE